MPILEVGFDIRCNVCGANLEANTATTGVIVFVEPCEKCLAAAREEGYNDGYNEGYSKGYDKGYDKGYNDAFREKGGD